MNIDNCNNYIKNVIINHRDMLGIQLSSFAALPFLVSFLSEKT